ncbi:MAG: hypothetical protein WA958_22165 [Tunicatimonas sp.]
MYRIFNGLATTEFNRAIAAVEVNFNGQGGLALYDDTMDIAISTAVTYNVNQWLFTKNTFHDMDVDHFLLFIRKWFGQNNESWEESAGYTPRRVALLTTTTSYEHLAEKHQWLSETRPDRSQLQLRVFFDRKGAEHHLLRPSQKKYERRRSVYASGAL